MRSLVVVMFVVSLMGCHRDAPVLIYKSRVKGDLIEVCAKHGECVGAVSENFDNCADDAAIQDMIMTISPEESEEKNRKIARDLVACINKEGGGQYLKID